MGRKPVDDKKQEVKIWVKGSVIEKNGGMANSKEKAINYLIKEAEEKPETLNKK